MDRPEQQPPPAGLVSQTILFPCTTPPWLQLRRKPGYPTENPPTGKKKWFSRSKPKGDRGFIEGCLFALCCCWLCEMCF